MPVPHRFTEAAHRLWDELADRSIERGDETLLYLLDQACRLIGADTAVWIGAVRLSDLGEDSLSGWRPRGIFSLHPSTEQVDQVRRRDMKLYARGEPDITTLRQVEGAGTWRVNRLVDLVPPEWFESDYYQWRYKALGRDDAIWAVSPVNPDAECYYGIYRSSKHHRFTPEERDGFGYILRGLKWFHRRQMLGNGLLIADTPLTPTERKVLHGLLAGRSEKEIAAQIGQTYNTTHHYVGTLYRKFAVTNRSALVALWLGATPEGTGDPSPVSPGTVTT